MTGLIFFHSQVLKKYGLLPSILSSLFIAFLPFYLTFSRMPWNGSSYLPLLLIFFTLLYFYEFRKKRTHLFLIGLLAGIIINIELVISFLLLFVIVYLLIVLKQKVNIIYFLIGVAVTFLPLVLFEMRHGFIMLKNTFLIGSYKNIMVAKTASVTDYLSSQLGINLIIYLACIFILLIISRKKRDKIFIAGFFVLLVIYSLIFRSHLAQHYIFPLSLLAAFTLIMTILNSKKVWLLIFVLLLVILSFPKKIYNYSRRKPEVYEKTVKYVLDQKLIQKNEVFNIIQYSKDYKMAVPIGHEYRYFFSKYGFKPNSEFEFNSSDILLIFSEINDLKLKNLNSWEIEQFGKKNLDKSQKFKIGNITVYKIIKINEKSV